MPGPRMLIPLSCVWLLVGGCVEEESAGPGGGRDAAVDARRDGEPSGSGGRVASMGTGGSIEQSGGASPGTGGRIGQSGGASPGTGGAGAVPGMDAASAGSGDGSVARDAAVDAAPTRGSDAAATADAARDAARSTDAEHFDGDGGGPVCNALVHSAPTVVATEMPAADTPAGVGGEIVDGIYHLTGTILYRDHPLLGQDIQISQTMEIQGDQIRMVASDNRRVGFVYRANFSFETSGASISMTLQCEDSAGAGAGPVLDSYTATATTVTVYSSTGRQSARYALR